jgi:hypothetical protein
MTRFIYINSLLFHDFNVKSIAIFNYIYYYFFLLFDIVIINIVSVCELVVGIVVLFLTISLEYCITYRTHKYYIDFYFLYF